jgi:hypothetical protein
MFKGDAITFGRLHTWTLSFFYDKKTDILIIRSPWQQAGSWVDLPDGVRVKVDSQTGDALEFHIARFVRGFLATRPDLQATWGQVKPNPIALKRMEATPFIRHLLGHMEQLAYQRTKALEPSKL